MDLIGEIVEHSTQKATPPTAPTVSQFTANGFPKKTSKFKSRLLKNAHPHPQPRTSPKLSPKLSPRLSPKLGPTHSIGTLKTLDQAQTTSSSTDEVFIQNEKEAINKENQQFLAQYSEAEIIETKNELLSSLDPKLLNFLMKKAKKDEEHVKKYSVIEGDGTWIGGDKSGKLIYDDNDDDDDVSSPVPLSTSSTSISSNTASNLKSSLKKRSSSSSSIDKKVRFNSEAKVFYDDSANATTSSRSNSVTGPADEVIQEEEWEDVQPLNDDSESSDTENNSATCNPVEGTTKPKRKGDNDNADQAIYQSNLDDIKKLDNLTAPEIISGVHFPKPTTPYEELDIDDPKFQEKLHAKYFPDLPKNIKQLDWMKPLPKKSARANEPLEYDSIESIRFDLNGNIITSEPSSTSKDKYENEGLYHHSANPELPGYTMSELAHLLRSQYAPQRCVSIRTFGRILYKLGSALYGDIIEVDDEDQQNKETIKHRGVETEFEAKCWELIFKLKVIDLLEIYSGEKERNLSVRNYAIESLYLWNEGGGLERCKRFNTVEGKSTTK